MHFLLVILVLVASHTFTEAEKCSRPNLTRVQAYIYRTMARINLKIHRCFYNDTRSGYSDISNHCLSAFKTKKFRDKWGQNRNLKSPDTPIVLEDYVGLADPLRNLIQLRSGTVCRYDRGFCYDPKESIDYAAVWEVIPVPPEKCPITLEQVFYGNVDFWTFTPENLRYLFYYDSRTDRSFFLRLATLSTCHNKQVWYTDEHGYIISLYSLTQYFQPTKKLNQIYFPLTSKRLVSEAILKDCDLRAYSTDFDKQIKSDYLDDPENLKTILKQFQSQIKNNTQSNEQFKNKFKLHEGDKKAINNIRVALGLHKVQFEKIYSLLRNTSLNKTDCPDDAHYKLISTDEDLYEKIKKINKVVDALENSFKNVSSSNAESIAVLKDHFSNLEEEIEAKWSSLPITNFNSIEAELEKLNDSIYENGKSVLSKLEPIILSSINDSSLCSEKINDIESKFEEFLINVNEDRDTIGQNITKYVNTIRNDTAIKLEKSNSKLRYLETRLNDLINKEDINKKEIVEMVEDLYKNTSLNHQICIDGAFKLKDEMQKKHDLFSSQIETYQKLNDKNIESFKNSTAKDYDNFKKDMFKKLLSTSTCNDLAKVNTTLLNRIDFSDSEIKQLQKELKEYKINTDTDKNATDQKLNELINNTSGAIEKLSEIPLKIEETILNKVNPKLSSLNGKCKSCDDGIIDLKEQTDQLFENLKEELIESFTLGDKRISENLNKINNYISDRVTSEDSKLQNFENQLVECKNFAGINKNLIDNGLEEIKKNVTSLFDFLNNLSLQNDQNILSKYNLLLDHINEKSNECENAINHVISNFNDSVINLKNDMYQQCILTEAEITKRLDNVNKSLLNEIETSEIEMKELESKIDKISFAAKDKDNEYETKVNEINDSLTAINRTLNDMPSKVEDLVVKKVNTTINYLKDKCTNCEQGVNSLKNNIEESSKTLRNEILNKYSICNNNLENKMEFLNLTIKKNSDTIRILESSMSNNSKTNANVNSKIQYLIKQTESTSDNLQNNINDVNRITNIVKDLENRIRDLDTNSRDSDSNLTKLNQTLEQNNEILKNLQIELNNLKISTNHSEDSIGNQIRQLITDTLKNSEDIEELQKKFTGSHQDITQLQTDYINSQQLLQQYEKEIQELKQNLSLTNKILYENQNVIKDLNNEIDKTKLELQKNEIHFGFSISNLNNLIEKNANKTLEVKDQIINLTKCCKDNESQLNQKDKEIEELKDEFKKAIEELRAEQKKLKDIVNNPIEVDPL